MPRDCRTICATKMSSRVGRISFGKWIAALGVALLSPVGVRAQDAPPPEPPKPALYSLPWLLRPAIPGTVTRLDETIAFFQDPVSKASGETYVTSIIASYKLAPEWSVLFRETWVSNSPPEGGPDPSGSGWSNALLGAF